jgi:hypothetical protein
VVQADGALSDGTAQNVHGTGRFRRGRWLLALLISVVAAAVLLLVIRPGRSVAQPAPAGFKSETVDPQVGLSTGPLTYAEASSATCGGFDQTAIEPSDWRSSTLWFFDDNTAAPETTVTLCVTTFATPTVARRDFDEMSVLIRSKSRPDGETLAALPLPGTLDGVGRTLSSATLGVRALAVQVAFIRGANVGWIVLTALSSGGDELARQVAVSLATAENARL